ncbi:hypothetical protein WJ95_09550 [Burkholderia ubonensis]|nr:hypothetical protein WJ95_09550 [Burkholderia ubonensis]
MSRTQTLKEMEGFLARCDAITEKNIEQPAAPADEHSVFDWLRNQISAVDCWHRGDPSYEHDAYWMKERALKLVGEAESIFATNAAAAPADERAAFEITSSQKIEHEAWLLGVSDRPVWYSPSPDTGKQLIEAVLNHSSATGSHAFCIPIQATTPQLFVAMGERDNFGEMFSSIQTGHVRAETSPAARVASLTNEQIAATARQHATSFVDGDDAITDLFFEGDSYLEFARALLNGADQ